MRLLFYTCMFIMVASCRPSNALQNGPSPIFAQSQQFELAPPMIKAEAVLFEEKNEVALLFALKDAKVHYTLDGSEPTEQSPLYREKIVLVNSTIIKAKAFHPNHRPSEMVTREFVKLGEELTIKKITTNRRPHENYLGSGVEGLIDRKKGTTNFRTPLWMGFSGGELEILIEFEKEESLRKTTVSLLSDPNAWIFMPKAMVVLGSKNGENYEELNTIELSPTAKEASTALRFLTAELEAAPFKFVKILLKSFAEIPVWHPGKGRPPWLFIDEIIVE